MANFTVPDNPEFNFQIRKFEPTDEGHADLFNFVAGNLFVNDLAILAILEAMTDPDVAETAFQEVYETEGGGADPTAMDADQVEAAIETQWNGESSPDPTALSADQVEAAIETQWNGESSPDPTALSAEQVAEALTK